jgi:hypothetical protein
MNLIVDCGILADPSLESRLDHLPNELDLHPALAARLSIDQRLRGRRRADVGYDAVEIVIALG